MFGLAKSEHKSKFITMRPILLLFLSMAFVSNVSSSNSNNNNPNTNMNNINTGDTSNASALNKINNLGGIGSDTVQLSSRVVHTKYGSVSGVIVNLEGRHLDPVEAFKGIPYASPPIGSLRFMPPVTGALWSGVRKADR